MPLLSQDIRAKPAHTLIADSELTSDVLLCVGSTETKSGLGAVCRSKTHTSHPTPPVIEQEIKEFWD
jgi:hypothetical protein